MSFLSSTLLFLDGDSANGIAIRHGLDGPGIESRWGQIFLTPHGLLFNEYRVSYPWGKAAGHRVDHPPHLSPTLKKE